MARKRPVLPAAGTHDKRPVKQPPKPSTPQPELKHPTVAEAPSQPFTGPLQRLERLGTVRPGTVVVLFVKGQTPVVKGPGELLIPGWVPFLRTVHVLPVTTDTVTLDVTVDELQALDGATLERVELRVLVGLRETAVQDLATEHGAALGLWLMQEVQNGVESGVRSAVRMNREQDLRRQSLMHVLKDRWLPTTFAHGALIQRGFAVRAAAWALKPGESPPARSSRTSLDLTLDAKLRRLWRQHTEVELAGIAGARADGHASVVAVAETTLDPVQVRVLRELFAQHYDDPGTVLVVSSATSHEGVVRSWFSQVGNGSDREISVESLGDGEVLRVGLGDSPGSTTIKPPDQKSAEVAALRRLLPHRSIEFLAGSALQ